MVVGLESLSRELMSWYENSSIKAINIISVPYQGFAPLGEILKKGAARERVLYITGSSSGKGPLSEYLEKLGILFSFKEDDSSSLVVLDFEESFRSRENYGLIIYDDLNDFPNHRKQEVQELLNFVYPRGRRIVAYSLEKVFRNVIDLELPLIRTHGFVTEPRFIDTRVNIRSSIPNTIYEYIKFFHNEKRHVMIFVPDNATFQGMTDYLRRIDPDLPSSIHDVTDLEQSGIRELLKRHGEGGIFFSEKLSDFRDIPVNFEFILSNADSPQYDYRQFVFLCLRSGLYEDMNGEVILTAQTMTRDMQHTKELTQNFNRVLWEKDQLFL